MSTPTPTISFGTRSFWNSRRTIARSSTVLNALEQIGYDRALRLDERSLVPERVRRGERAPLAEAEVARATSLHREAVHRDAVDHRLPGRELIRPRPVVARGRRRYLDVEVRTQSLRHRAGMRLRAAAGDVAVALHDDHEARVG